MGKVVPFSKIEAYLNEVLSKDASVRIILDTNILIATSYEIKENYDVINTLFKFLEEKGCEFFTTVNTKAEFMDFYRRLTLTEALLDLVDGQSKVKIPKSAVEEIKKCYASIKSKQARDGSDAIFNDTQIKSIKSEFSAGIHSGHMGWLKLCEFYLDGYIAEIEKTLHDRGILYLSPNNSNRTHLFTSSLEWANVAVLVEKTGLSVSDAMILNALNCSVCRCAMSTDFDFGFAVLADLKNKDVLMPDAIEREYRHYHFTDR